MARPPKSPSLKALQGDTRQRGKRKGAKGFFSAPAEPVPEPPPLPQPEKYPPPANLNDAAKEIWRAEISAVAQRTMLKVTDHRTFALYCAEVARLARLEDTIAERGEVYETVSKHGSMLRVNPACALRDRCLQTVIKLATELNLTTRSWIASQAQAASRQLDLFGGRAPPEPDPKPESPVAPAPGQVRPPLGDYMAGKPNAGIRH